MTRIHVIGGGIAGLSVGWELARRNRPVTVLEANEIGSGTSTVATSYLEPRLGTTPARKLEWQSLRLWPAFASELQDVTGIRIGYRASGQWRYAFADDEAEVRADFEVRRDGGWACEWLSGEEVQRREPDISSEVTAAAAIYDPAWVDGPAVCRALAAAITNVPGCEVREHTIVEPSELHGHLVIAAGEGANALGLDLPTVRVTKGTTLFYPTDLQLSRMLRHKTLSIVPRADGLIVGSSRERGETSLEPDPAIVGDLHEKAVRILPALASVQPQPRCGFRALVGDGSLNLGRSGDVYWSLSQAGVGYLRAPLVARELAAVICGHKPDFIAPFYRG